ncbi:MAG: permease [Bdellovibrionota bacterium]
MNQCGPGSWRGDWVLWISLAFVIIGFIYHLFGTPSGLPDWVSIYSEAVYTLMNKMWWGLALGILFVAIFSRVPKEFVISALGRTEGLSGILRATLLGLCLDLCSHGILLVGMKLYERGASLGQTMAFLIASPWNSLSLTVILFSLIGWKWTLIFILLSAVIAVLSGVIFEFLVSKGSLHKNTNRIEIPADFNFFTELKAHFKTVKFSFSATFTMLKDGFFESGMILRWIFFGVVLTGLIQAFVPTDIFMNYFGASLAGLGFTLLAATVIEVCSEGSLPIAADLLTRAAAPGNSFTFLMAGVATDYTEVLALKETTKSWKIALFLPLVTVPQVLVLGYILNQF